LLVATGIYERQRRRVVTNINEIVGLVLLALGAVTWVICLIAFVMAMGPRKKKGAEEILHEVDAIIRAYAKILQLLPKWARPVFLLLAFGLILIVAGLYVLTAKPI